MGRRWGKDELGAEVLLDGALRERGIYWGVAPIHEQAEFIRRYFLRRCPKELILQAQKSRRLYTLSNGSTVQFKTADDPDALRGEGLSGLVIIEPALVLTDIYIWENVLYHNLGDKDGWGFALGSPKGKGAFYRLYNRGLDPEQPEYASFPGPKEYWATFHNPWYPAKLIKNLFRLPYPVFRQEVLGMFIEDQGAIFRNVDECADARPAGPQPGRYYILGIDLAKYQDFTVLSVWDRESRKQVYFDRFHQIDWTFQMQRIISVYKLFNQAKIVVDSTGVGDPIYESLERGGYNPRPVNFGQTGVKQAIIEKFAMAFQEKRLHILDNPVQTEELKSFQYRYTSGGRVQYSAPEGEHDDTVIAGALAWDEVDSGLQPFIAILEV
ncbi:MAG: hypothetical protein L0Y74_10535 [candidate division Zixibacteria bacterium]|nr:hypothetical protein [candidate division Zixibacteria bacterium]